MKHITLLPFLIIETALAGGFANFTNQTDSRLEADSSLGSNDDREKDYAWGDVDLDGDIYLICVRKEPFTTTGHNVNVLFMNEGGVLVDRTQEYASSSDVAGDSGFRTPTNDRDVVLADLDLDGWLDFVTVTTLSDNEPKHISHPRVYMNLGEIDGIWQGFRFENDRMPQMHTTASPRFCSLAIGDINGDPYPDLYFGDYDSGPSQIYDYNNRLLINDGNGYFTDESTQRMTSEMLLSAFGAASVIADMNNDGVDDVVKQTSLNPPQHIAITYNNPSNEGYFNGYDIIDTQAPYFVSVGDLNGDGRLDLVVVDDASDHYYLNTGNGGDGFANFSSHTFENSNGFGGNSIVIDINNDGHNDVIITDVDVDITGCSRTTHIYRNLGNTPNVSFSEQFVGISNTQLKGVHDVAVFDINGDGWNDLVMGRCNSTEIWIQDAPTGIVFAYPEGLPNFIPPEQDWAFRVSTDLIGKGEINPKSAQITIRVDGQEETYAMNTVRTNIFLAVLPATPCAEMLEFRISVSLKTGATFSDPATGWYGVTAGDGTDIVFRDEMEEEGSNESAWTISSSNGLTTGEWERVDPNGTIYNSQMAAPEDDATGGAQNTMCYVTENGEVGGSVGSADVDNGSTNLISPILEVNGTNGIISYDRWFFDSQGTDQLDTYISNDDGVSWVLVHSTGSTGSEWETTSFVIADYVEPTDLVRVGFTTEDLDPASIVEAGIDNFQLEVVVCGGDCVGDIDGDGNVAVGDLLLIIADWGGSNPSTDLDGNGIVAVGDLLIAIGNWGPCEG
ncbi:MAG TPA: hypothetical protein EYM64_02030 [Phycisphaerales bacterium]|nr:hypothetical protein [Phycisphaerales bacterium]